MGQGYLNMYMFLFIPWKKKEEKRKYTSSMIVRNVFFSICWNKEWEPSFSLLNYFLWPLNQYVLIFVKEKEKFDWFSKVFLHFEQKIVNFQPSNHIGIIS